MVFRIGRDGNETRVEVRDLRKGDVFYMVDGAGEGPLLEAVADAEQRPSRRDPNTPIWGCRAQFAGEFEGMAEPQP